MITLMLALSSATFAGSKAKPTPSQDQMPIPIEIPTTGVGHVGFDPVKNYSAKDLAALRKAEVLSNELLQSQCFSDFMIKRALIQTGGKTPMQVVEHLKTRNLTVPVTMYYSRKNVVGYRNVGSPIVYTNLKFHAGSTACARASNLTHEWSHVPDETTGIGYGHDYKATRQRPYSVPYSINAAFDKCCVCAPKSILDCTIVQ